MPQLRNVCMRFLAFLAEAYAEDGTELSSGERAYVRDVHRALDANDPQKAPSLVEPTANEALIALRIVVAHSWRPHVIGYYDTSPLSLDIVKTFTWATARDAAADLLGEDIGAIWVRAFVYPILPDRVPAVVTDALRAALTVGEFETANILFEAYQAACA